MNRFIFPIFFGGILLIAAMALMLFQQMQTEEVAGAGDKDDEKVTVAAAPSGGGGMGFALQMMWEDLTGSTTVRPQVDISDLVPPDPEGWYATDYRTKDGEEITKATFSRSPIAKNSTNTILQRFDDAAQGKGNAIARSYLRGSQRIAFLMYVPDQFNTNTIRGGIMSSISNQMSMDFGSTGRRTEVFALHNGVPIIEAAPFSKNVSSGTRVPVDYRVFNADVGGMFKIQILTNASDASVAEVLESVPMGELIAKLPEPEPQLLISTEFQTYTAELSREVPGPTVARRAYLLVKTRLDYSEDEKSMLNRMADGGIKSWDDAYERYGTLIGYAPEIVDLLGPLPALAPSLQIEYTARALTKTDREWNDTEDRILSGMARQRITQRKDVDRYLKDGEVLSEEVIALIRLLPQTYDAVAVTSPALAPSNVSASELVIRRGTKIGQGENTFGNCKIELGVRRCVVGGSD